MSNGIIDRLAQAEKQLLHDTAKPGSVLERTNACIEVVMGLDAAAEVPNNFIARFAFLEDFLDVARQPKQQRVSL